MAGRIRVPPDPSELPKNGWVGVDPGKDGTIGYVWSGDPDDFDDPGGAEFWRFDQLTDQQIWDVFQALAPKSKAAALEKVHSMPKQGVASSFKFGVSSGKCQAWLAAARFRWDWVTPQKWQKDLRCRTGGDKKITQAKAQQLWPHLQFTQKNAEGLLIAEWCRLHADWGR